MQSAIRSTEINPDIKLVRRQASIANVDMEGFQNARDKKMRSEMQRNRIDSIEKELAEVKGLVHNILALLGQS